MDSKNIIPQMEIESANTGAQKARYVAYMQCVRKLEMKAQAEAASKAKADRIGGIAR